MYGQMSVMRCGNLGERNWLKPGWGQEGLREEGRALQGNDIHEP